MIDHIVCKYHCKNCDATMSGKEFRNGDCVETYIECAKCGKIAILTNADYVSLDDVVNELRERVSKLESFRDNLHDPEWEL